LIAPDAAVAPGVQEVATITMTRARARADWCTSFRMVVTVARLVKNAFTGGLSQT
jgi:hypothetical protein